MPVFFGQVRKICVKLVNVLTGQSSESQNENMKTRFDKAKTVLEHHRNYLARLGTQHLGIFGSMARNEATKKSDIDILVDFDAKKELFCFCRSQILAERDSEMQSRSCKHASTPPCT